MVLLEWLMGYEAHCPSMKSMQMERRPPPGRAPENPGPIQPTPGGFATLVMSFVDQLRTANAFCASRKRAQRNRASFTHLAPWSVDDVVSR